MLFKSSVGMIVDNIDSFQFFFSITYVVLYHIIVDLIILFLGCWNYAHVDSRKVPLCLKIIPSDNQPIFVILISRLSSIF